MSKKSMYATLATFAAFCGGVPGFGGFWNSGKYHKSSYNRLELGNGMSSGEMGTKRKKKLPKSKRNKHHKNKTESKPRNKCYEKKQVLFYKGGIK